MIPSLPPLLDDADPLVGKVIDGRFRVDAFLARGGMGKVYRATQLGLGRSVAVKVLDVRHTGDLLTDFERRFFREAEVVAQLRHPNTLRVHDFGRTEWGDPYLVMELLTGQTLAEVFRSGPVDPARMLAIVIQACGSLAEAHELGVVHRDLKPSNLFLSPEEDAADFVKVVDFGLVKRLDDDLETTRAGVLLGSPLYMAPEQIQGEPLDSRIDIYALGMVLFIGLTGVSPFKATQVSALLVAHVTDNVPSLQSVAPDLGLTASLNWVVQRCLDKSPEDRFASMRELARALSACSAELRGEVSGLTMQLRDGAVVVPAGLEHTLAGMLPARVGSGAWLRGPTRGAGLLVAGAALAVACVSLVMVLLVPGSALRTYFVSGSAVQPSPVSAVIRRPEAVIVAPAVEVVLTTTPQSAEITHRGAYIGNGRAVFDLEANTWLTLTVSAPGYREQPVMLDGSVSEVHVALAAMPVMPLPRSFTPRSSQPVAAPQGPSEGVDGEVAPPEPAGRTGEDEVIPAQSEPVETWVGSGDIRDPWGETP